MRSSIKRNHMIYILAISLLLLLPSISFASVNIASTASSGQSYREKFVKTADGTLWILMKSSTTTSIMLYNSTTNGSAWSLAGQVANTSIDDRSFALQANSTGQLLMAYINSTGGKVNYVTFTPSTNVFSAPTIISSVNPTTTNIVLCVNQTDGIWLVSNATSNVSSDGGNTWAGGTITGWGGFNLGTFCSIGKNNIFELVIVDRTVTANNSFYYLNSTDGTTWPSGKNFLNLTYIGTEFGDVISDLNGNTHMIFMGRNASGGNYKIIYVNKTGDAFSQPFNITANESTQALGMGMIENNNSMFYIMFTDSVTSKVYYMNSTAAAMSQFSWGAPIQADNNANYAPFYVRGSYWPTSNSYTNILDVIDFMFYNSTGSNIAYDNLTFDFTPPAISYVPPTPTDASTIGVAFAFINITAVDAASSVDSCVLQWNGVNETMTKAGSGTSVACFVNKTGLSFATAFTYKTFANDSLNNTAQGAQQTVTTNNGNAPVIQAARLIATSLGSLNDLRLQVNASDPDGAGDLDSCFVGATVVKGFTNGLCEVNMTDSLSQDFLVWVNDSVNNNVSFRANFSLTNASYLQDANPISNFTYQAQRKNDTLAIGGTNGLNYTINHSTPAGGTLVQGFSFSGSLATGASAFLYSNWTGDWATETFGTEGQDMTRVTDAGVNAFTRFLFNLTEAAGINWANLALNARCRSGWTQNESTINLSSGQALTNHILGCSNSTIISKSRNRYNITDANITVGSDSTGFIELLINNTDTLISWGNVSVNVSQGGMIPAGWNINDTQIKTLALANASHAMMNFSLNRSSPLVTERAPTVAECTGFAIFSEYCLQTAFTDLGSGRTNYTYTYRAFLNVTDGFVASQKITYLVSLGRLTNWDLRTGGSENVTLNGSSTNTSLSDGAANVTILIDTNFNATSGTSLTTGESWKAEITYSRITTVGPSPGGGGGGGVTVISATPNLTLRINPENKEFFIKPGQDQSFTYVLRNQNSTKQTVKLTLEPRNSDPSYRWGLFSTGNLVFTEQTVEVPAGTPENPGTAQFNLTVRVPANADTATYSFNIVAQSDAAPRQVSVAKIIVGGFSITATGNDVVTNFIGALANFAGFFIAFPKPVFGISGIAIWQIGIIFFAIFIGVLYVSSVRWLHRKGAGH